MRIKLLQRVRNIGLILAVTLTVVVLFTGCNEPDWSAINRDSVDAAAKACAHHGGVGYLNLDSYYKIDELRCKSGARVEH